MINHFESNICLGRRLICLTVLLFFAQGIFFSIHLGLGGVIDTLSSTAIFHSFTQPAIFMPLMGVLLLQIVLYSLLTLFAWYVGMAIGELLQLPPKEVYSLGIFYWVMLQFFTYGMNAYFYPASFFASNLSLIPRINIVIMLGSGCLVFVGAILAVIHSVMFRRRVGLSIFFAALLLVFMFAGRLGAIVAVPSGTLQKPNIILIGIDSLRPDRTHYFGNTTLKTPTIDHFMQHAVVFSHAYTPLARTFPSWISLLTAKHPIHSGARANLVDINQVSQHDNLAKRLQADGYLTIYGTDEPRFTDITKKYGFDRLIGPPGGVAEFVAGTISDFPLSNLLVNLPVGRWLLPYSQGNREVDMTYMPSRFINLIQAGLAERKEQPVFLALHLCITHWPLRYARDGQEWYTPAERYDHMIEVADTQLADLMVLLRREGLLEHAVVVLLSDHGVTMGEHHARVIDPLLYQGPIDETRNMERVKLASSPDFTMKIKENYALDASYGQGTDVLSVTQYHPVLAVRGYGVTYPAKRVDAVVSLMDVAPTILQLEKLPALSAADGLSLMPYLTRETVQTSARPIYFETGDKLAALEKKEINEVDVLRAGANAYEVAQGSGLLQLTPDATRRIINSKERAIILGDWLLARYPETVHVRMLGNKKRKVMVYQTSPVYFVLVNLRTGKWTLNMKSKFAENAPVAELMSDLKEFYAGEF